MPSANVPAVCFFAPQRFGAGSIQSSPKSCQLINDFW